MFFIFERSAHRAGFIHQIESRKGQARLNSCPISCFLSETIASMVLSCPNRARARESSWGQVHLGSDSKNPPKARHRFSFSGQTKQPKVSIIIHPPPAPTPVSNDDILDSMTKHTRPQDFPQDQASQFEDEQTVVSTGHRHRGSARGALAVFLGGFVSVWLYGYVTKAYDIPYLSGVTQSPEIQAGIQLASSHPIILGAVTGTFLLGALGAFYLKHRRKN
jgi:hypothetical protein